MEGSFSHQDLSLLEEWRLLWLFSSLWITSRILYWFIITRLSIVEPLHLSTKVLKLLTSHLSSSTIFESETFIIVNFRLCRILSANFRVLTLSSTEAREGDTFAKSHTLDSRLKLPWRTHVSLLSQYGMIPLNFFMLKAHKTFPKVDRLWYTSFFSLMIYLVISCW